MQSRFGHVARDAGCAAIKLVGDQDSTASARTGRPPADAIGRLLCEVRENVGSQRRPVRQLHSQRLHGCCFGRICVFGIWCVQTREISRPHSDSVARYEAPHGLVPFVIPSPALRDCRSFLENAGHGSMQAGIPGCPVVAKPSNDPNETVVTPR